MLLFAVVVLVATALTAVRAEQVPPRRPPRISDEEDNTLARKFECPACTAAFWEIDHALWSAEHSPFRSSTKVDSNTPLTESEYIDVLEKACEFRKGSGLYNYVIRVNATGQNTITGRGLFPPELQPAFYRGRIPAFLGQKCQQLVGGMGEDELYEAYRETSREELFEQLCQTPCKQHGSHFLMPRAGESSEKTSQQDPQVDESKRKKRRKKRRKKKKQSDGTSAKTDL